MRGTLVSLFIRLSFALRGTTRKRDTSFVQKTTLPASASPVLRQRIPRGTGSEVLERVEGFGSLFRFQ
jgi:hypothetical protein